MKTLLLALLLSSAALAQNTLKFAKTSVKVRQGDSVTVNVNYTAANSAGLQWAMVFPPGVTVTSLTPVAGKTLNCKTDSTLCILHGVNRTIIPVGRIASYSLAFPISAAIGTATVTLSAPLGTNATGVSIPVTAGPPLVITVTRRR